MVLRCTETYSTHLLSSLLFKHGLTALPDILEYKHTCGRVGIWAPAHWCLGEIDGLLVPPGKASNLLTDHLITG